MADIATKTAAAVLEIDRLGRLSDKTRDDLAEALADAAGGRDVDVPDDQAETETETKTGAKASGARKGA